jgi:hypothetical protein
MHITMACASIVTELAPFCAPTNNTVVSALDQVTSKSHSLFTTYVLTTHAGSRLSPSPRSTRTNHSSVVTWDPSYFNSSDTMVQIQADFSPAPDTGITDPTPDTDTGFTSGTVRADAGSYVWNVSSSQAALYSGGASSTWTMDAQLYIVQTNTTSGSNETRTLGPLLRIVPGTTMAGENATTSPTAGQNELGDSGPDMSASGLNLVAVLVPLGVGLLLLAALAAYLYNSRRKRLRQQQQQGMSGADAPVAASWTLRGRHGPGKDGGAVEGYGMESRAVPMDDIGISRPRDGRNVFQAEIQRQEAERRV